MDLTRRQFIRLAVGVAGFLQAMPAMTTEASFLPQCGLSPGKPGVGPIDIHSHVFNATDLQVERFLSLALAAEFPLPLRRAIYFLAPILQTAGWIAAPSGEKELNKLKEFEKRLALGASADETRSLLEQHRKEGQVAFIDAFADQLRTPAGQNFLDAYAAYRTSFLAKQQTLALVDRELRQFRINDLKTAHGLAEYLVLEKRSPGIAQVYNFASNFFHYRHVNALFLLENYGCVNKIRGSQGPGIFCTALVDFDYGLGVGRFPTPTPLDGQIAVMSRIQVVSDGRIFPFVPFDPWRYVYEGESALKRVTDAITDGGAVGVKLYPPMGFAPYGNAILNPKPMWPVKDFPDFGKRLDQAMGALFSWCIQAQVPVLAHANPSNAAHPSYKRLGSPENWRTALAAYPKLRVCFGHFGGECLLDKPQACEGGSGWGMGFLQCLADPNGTNAYGDASYFADALEEKNRPALVRRLRAFYTSGGELARSRILYGSDWQMIAIEPRSDFYYQELELVIQQLESDFPGLANQFFIENAARYLGLGPNGATRKRIMDFVARHKGSANWLDAPVLNR